MLKRDLKILLHFVANATLSKTPSGSCSFRSFLSALKVSAAIKQN